MAYWYKIAFPIKVLCYLMSMLGDATYAIDAILQEHREGAVLQELVSEMKEEKEEIQEEIRQSMLQEGDVEDAESGSSSSSEESPTPE